MSIVRQHVDQKPRALQNEVYPFLRRQFGQEIEFELDLPGLVMAFRFQNMRHSSIILSSAYLCR
jgi:hypothetical protein